MYGGRRRRGQPYKVGFKGPLKRQRIFRNNPWWAELDRFEDDPTKGVVPREWPDWEVHSDLGIPAGIPPTGDVKTGNILIYREVFQPDFTFAYEQVANCSWKSDSEDWRDGGGPVTEYVVNPPEKCSSSGPVGSLPSSDPNSDIVDGIDQIASEYGRQVSTLRIFNSSSSFLFYIHPGPVGLIADNGCFENDFSTTYGYAIWGAA